MKGYESDQAEDSCRIYRCAELELHIHNAALIWMERS